MSTLIVEISFAPNFILSNFAKPPVRWFTFDSQQLKLLPMGIYNYMAFVSILAGRLFKAASFSFHQVHV